MIFKSNSEIGLNDACLCTEIFVNESFIDQKNKTPLVKKCLNSFKNFENAHLECIKTIPLSHPEIKTDSLKSI
jgi:hypothetical protein